MAAWASLGHAEAVPQTESWNALNGAGEQIAAATEISKERLARIDGLMQQYVDENLIAGAVALILQNGQPVYQHAAGWSDKEAGTRMTTDTIFRIASQTKALTSVAILQLQEQGKLVVTDPVSKYIPEFAKTTVLVKNESGATSTVPATRPITLRDLLTHTAGISYGTQPRDRGAVLRERAGPGRAGNGWYTADKNEPTCTTMARLASLPFQAQPGAAFVYGYNTDILGCVVERASGMPLDEYFRTQITQPLGMKDTQFFLPPGSAPPAGRRLYVAARTARSCARRTMQGPGPLRRRSAQEFRGRRGIAVDRPATTRVFSKRCVTAACSTARASCHRAASR